jgi:hypothetical protein
MRLCRVVEVHVLHRDIYLTWLRACRPRAELWCWAITGTLDPVCGLTRLTVLDVSINVFGGMSVLAAVAIRSMLCVVLVYASQCGGAESR